MSTARFNVLAFLDRTKPTKGTVEIDRETKMFAVRPHRSHKTYEMPLDTVASMVVRACVIDEVNQKHAERARKKKGGG